MSDRKIYPPKAPNEVLRYGYNWSPKNIGSEQIVDIDATVISGGVSVLANTVEDVPNAREGQGTVHVISGGTLGELAEILLTATTDAVPPSVLQQTVYIPIQPK